MFTVEYINSENKRLQYIPFFSYSEAETFQEHMAPGDVFIAIRTPYGIYAKVNRLVTLTYFLAITTNTDGRAGI